MVLSAQGKAQAQGGTSAKPAAPSKEGNDKSSSQKTDANYEENDIDVNKPGGARGPKIPWVIVQMVNAKGANIGRATITALNTGGVEVKLDLSDLPPGEHALHFHQVPKCDPPDFKSAGAHFNPEKKQHGLENPKGPHAGDMENFSVGPDGITTATVNDPNVSLGGKNSVLAHGGTALVIHAKPDDMKTDPAGNSGDRIACGIVSH
ncbi:MAG TPA: superoxide dismutase family protein [Terriglobales bacterium]|nr:superoxide dismutase family protein [Terriglobales bacterium]